MTFFSGLRSLRSIGLALALILVGAGCGGGKPAAAGPGPGGAATRVKLSGPEGLLLDRDGNLYVSEFVGARVVRISPDGRLTVVAGTGTAGYSGDGGRAVVARLSEPTGMALDSDGNLAIADYRANVIRMVDAAGVIRTIDAGRPNHPIGLAFNGSDLYIAESGRSQVTKVLASGSNSIVAANVRPAYLLFDRARNLDVAASGDNVVIQIDGEAIVSRGQTIISTIAGTGAAGFGGDGGPATEAKLNPYGLAMDGDSNLYVSDRDHNRIRKIDREGIITTIAGTGTPGFGGDGGSAKSAKLNSPVALAIDGRGNVYIADGGNNRIRRVDPDGVITTVAGGGR